VRRTSLVEAVNDLLAGQDVHDSGGYRLLQYIINTITAQVHSYYTGTTVRKENSGYCIEEP
jgi:hypothetical protein